MASDLHGPTLVGLMPEISRAIRGGRQGDVIRLLRERLGMSNGGALRALAALVQTEPPGTPARPA
jgi:hypothetical protein